MTEHYEGSCHCGAVKFSYEGEKIERGLRCTCSLCKRKGTLMTTETIPIEKITIDAQEGVLGLYQFGAKTAKHFFCKNCGIYTFHETARKPGHYRANLGCIDKVDTFNMEAEVFDGLNLL